MEMFKHKQFLMKTFGGHTSLTNTISYFLENDCDEKKNKTLIDRGESFPGFKYPLLPFLKKLKSDF